MARTEVAVTGVTRAGVSQAATPGALGGHKFTNDGRAMIRVTNTHLTLARVITFPTFRQVDGLDVADLTVSVPADSSLLVGTFSPATFNAPEGDPDAGMMHVDYPLGFETDFSIELYGV